MMPRYGLSYIDSLEFAVRVSRKRPVICWTCDACTFINRSYRDECEMCDTPAQIPRIAPVAADTTGTRATMLEHRK